MYRSMTSMVKRFLDYESSGRVLETETNGANKLHIIDIRISINSYIIFATRETMADTKQVT